MPALLFTSRVALVSSPVKWDGTGTHLPHSPLPQGAQPGWNEKGQVEISDSLVTAGPQLLREVPSDQVTSLGVGFC